MAAKVYLVGAGPGDPGLVTLRGKQCIAKADVIVYDYLAPPTLLNYARKNAEQMFMANSGHVYFVRSVRMYARQALFLISFTIMSKMMLLMKHY